MKIAVYYIVTGPYTDYLDGFLNSLQNFFPEDEKIVKLISDNGEKYRNYENGNIKVEVCPRINHYPWPIIALYKHWHILQNLDETCEYICYFNANSIIHKNDISRWCDLEKLNISYHSFSLKPNILFPPDSIISNESTAYLKENTYNYTLDGFFFGKTALIKQICEEVVEMINKDSQKQIYAKWHDESYMNKWCETHLVQVNKNFIMTVYPEYLDECTFIELPRKNQNISNFKGI